MILHGDEMGRTQQGNNNTYCQDDELSWVDWDLDEHQEEMLWFTRRMIALRHEHPIFRRRRFLQGVVREDSGSVLKDVEWLATDGAPMTEEEWEDPENKCLTMFLNGSAIPEPTSRGERIVDDSSLVMFNASGNGVEFVLPGTEYGQAWEVVLGTGDTIDVSTVVEAGESIVRPGHSLLILMRPAVEAEEEDRAAEEIEHPIRA